MANNKDLLRKQYIKIRNNIVNRTAKSALIKERLLNIEAFNKASNIALFMSFGTEVDTYDIITTLLKRKK